LVLTGLRPSCKRRDLVRLDWAKVASGIATPGSTRNGRAVTYNAKTYDVPLRIELMNNQDDKKPKHTTIKSMATGLAIGLVIGVALKNIAVGVAMGVAIGAALGTAKNKSRKGKDK
jgi:hypothetical protein